MKRLIFSLILLTSIGSLYCMNNNDNEMKKSMASTLNNKSNTLTKEHTKKNSAAMEQALLKKMITCMFKSKL